MGARKTPEKGCTRGNFVSEWFGHTVWPQVDVSEASRINQGNRACPFLSAAVGKSEQCIKMAGGWTEPYGVCTVSSDSNTGSNGQRKRQSWVACPYRTLDKGFALLEEAVRFFYDLSDASPFLLPVSELNDPARRRLLAEKLTSQHVYLFSTQKLGGEISFPETEFSPSASVDASVIEVIETAPDGTPTVFGKHLLYEIQTADFHGSPLLAAELLKDRCPRIETPPSNYHQRLENDLEICGTGMEGPNKSNIFKRTIYQMILKISLSDHKDCAGFAIFIPEPVWDSWLKHLGNPTLVTSAGANTVRLTGSPPSGDTLAGARARVYVFAVDTESTESPRSLKIVQRVDCSAADLAFCTFISAPKQAIENHVVDRFRASFEKKISTACKQGVASENKPRRTKKAAPTLKENLQLPLRESDNIEEGYSES